MLGSHVTLRVILKRAEGTYKNGHPQFWARLTANIKTRKTNTYMCIIYKYIHTHWDTALMFDDVITVLLILHPQYDLWGPIVSGHHVGGHHEVSARRPGQAKVQDLQSAV